MNAQDRDDLQRRIEEEVKRCFPAGAVQRVSLLQYGDAPVIEPGGLLVQVSITPPPDSGSHFGDPTQAFEDAHRKAMKKLRTDLSRELPEAGGLEFTCDADGNHYSRLQTLRGRTFGAREREGGDETTPVMARLGAEDLETLDTLITAGIATSRADAVRWALVRIRERPAYRELRQRAQEIERLRAEF